MESTSSRYPCDFLAMDLLGPFPESNAGTLYILVITDHFELRISFLMTLKRATGKVTESSFARVVFAHGGHVINWFLTMDPK